MHSIGNEVNLRRGGVHAAVLPTTTLPVISSILISAIILSSFYWAFSPMETHGASLEVWWPQNGAHMEGTQPFKAVLQGEATDSYEMFWQVDGGVWNWMDTDSNDHPHKEARVSLRGWDWKGEGPYTVNFIARKNGSVIAQKSVEVYNDSARSSQSKKEEQKQEPKKEEATKEQQVEKKEEKPKEEEKDKPTVAATLAPKIRN